MADFGADDIAMEEVQAGDDVARVVDSILKSVPQTVRDSARPASVGGKKQPSKLEAALGFDPSTETVTEVDDDDADEVEDYLYGREGLLQIAVLEPAAVVGLVHALNHVPNDCAPGIIAAVLFAVLPLLFCGFSKLSSVSQAAFVTNFIPSVASFVAMRRVVEALEFVDVMDCCTGVRHVILSHDEGNDTKDRNALLLYATWRYMGTIIRKPTKSRQYPSNLGEASFHTVENPRRIILHLPSQRMSDLISSLPTQATAPSAALTPSRQAVLILRPSLMGF